MLSKDLNRNFKSQDALLILISVAAVLAVGAFLYARKNPTDQFISAFFLAYAVGVILHEMGHAMAAVAMGGTVDYVRLGVATGKRSPWQVRFLGLDWFIYGIPFSGSVHSSFYKVENYRLSRCVVIAAGPLVNIALFAFGMTLVVNFAAPSTENLHLMGWLIANGCILAYTVPPRMVRSYGALTPNDGLNFWRTLHQSDEEIRRIVESCQIARTFKAASAEAEKMSIAELLTKHESVPSNPAFLWYLTEKLRETNDDRYPDYFFKLISLPRMQEKTIANLLDSFLTWQLHRGQPERPEIADQLSERLLKTDDTISTRGTRGSVLIDLGRIEEGTAMLKDVLIKTTSTIDKSYANIFLALAAKQQGNLSLAREYAEKAAKIDPTCPALKRISDLLSSPPQAEKKE